MTVRKWRGVFAICMFLLVVVLTGCATAPHKPDPMARGDYGYTREYVTWLIKKEMGKNDVTGLSIALVDDQRIVWAEGFGHADEAKGVLATGDTVYRVGSITKLFTATAAMQLAEQGKFDIDKPLSTYIPEFSIRKRFAGSAPITPRTIMTHHSGLPSDLLKGMWTRRPEPFESVVAQLKDEYAAYPPNMVFSYSNVGMTLLGVALERASGRDYVSLMNDALLKPLGMVHSSLATGLDGSPLAAKAYREGKEAEETPLRDIPAGGLNSTVNDLSRFMEMIFAGGRSSGNRLIKPETLTEMLRPQNIGVPLDLNFRIGLNWALGGLGDIDIRNAGTVAHHSGATLNHNGMLIILPEHKLGVAVLANSATAGRVVNRVATEALKLALEAKTGIKQPERKSAPEGTASEETLKRYEGRYATFLGVIPVEKESGHLRAEIFGKTLRLAPRVDGFFALKYRLLGLIPISLGDLDYVGIGGATIAGREILKANIDGQELLIGERITPGPVPPRLLDMLGRYEPVNLGDDIAVFENVRLRHDNGLLIVDYELPLLMKGKSSFALKPLSDTEAVICGLGRRMGDTIRVVNKDGREYIRYSGYLLRKKAD